MDREDEAERGAEEFILSLKYRAGDEREFSQKLSLGSNRGRGGGGSGAIVLMRCQWTMDGMTVTRLLSRQLSPLEFVPLFTGG